MPPSVECPACGHRFGAFTPPETPRVAVDAIIETRPGSVVLVKRRFPPHGWALPGGFMETGEDTDTAVRREVREETALELTDLAQFRCYSTPDRDPRLHTVSVVYTARAAGEPKGGDDAADAETFPLDALPALAFDHADILRDYRDHRASA